MLAVLVPALALSVAGCGAKGGATAAPSPAAEGAAGAEAADGGPFLFEPVLCTPDLPPVAVAFAATPEREGFFVLGRNGDLRHFDRALESLRSRAGKTPAAPPRPSRFEGAIERIVIEDCFASGDMGSIGLALDPGFAANRHVYVWTTDKKDTHVRLDRFTWRGTREEIAASVANVITISRREPPAPYHMGGIVQFLPDESLLLAPGDAERPELAQDPMDLNGKLLRIVPRAGPEGGYEVPPDNPHRGDDGIRPEIVAKGVRAAFRAHLHRGRSLYFGDVGAEHEEVDVWTGSERDFGWGRGANTDGPTGEPGVAGPLVSWTKDRDWSGEDPAYNGETRVSAGVGVVYEPRGNDRYEGRLTGRLIFFDIMRGWIRSAPLAGQGLGPHEPLGHLQFIAQMHQGEDGYVYVLTWGRNPTLYRMTLAGS